MSAIGDYIHRNFKNYEIYGTARFGQQKQPLEVSLNAQRQKNNERINALNRGVDFERTLLELKQRVANESQQNTAKNMAMEKANFTKNKELLAENIRTWIMNNVGKDIGIITKLNKKNISIKNELVNVEEAKRYRRNLYENIDRANNDMKAGKSISKDRLDTIINNFNLFYYNLGLVASKENDFASLFKIKSNIDSLTALRSVASNTPLSEANKATYHGIYGEMLVNMADDTARVLAGKTLQQAMTNALQTGAETSSFSIDERLITKEVADTFKEDTGINLYQIRSSQNKVDASIVINDVNVEASVKAYTPRGNRLIPHLQDINLLTSLAATEQQFANHWLNLHVAQSTWNTAEIDQELKTHMAYEALVSGNLLKTGASIADTFVAIDVINGKVYTNSTYNILKNELNSSFILDPNIGNIRLDNEWDQISYEQRISNIIQQIHKIKVGVMFVVNLQSS